MPKPQLIAILSGSVLASSSALALQGAQGNLIVQRSDTTGLASFVTAKGGGPVDLGGGVVDPDDFLTAHGDLFGVTDAAAQLVTARVTTDPIGFTHTRYAQRHQGVTVFGGVLVVHQNAAGQVYAANGDFFPVRADLDTMPTIDEAAAGAVAINEMDALQPVIARIELVIVNPAWYGDPNIGVRLAYHLQVNDPATGASEAFFVDAHRGEVIDRWSMVHQARERSIHDAGGTGALPGELARFEGDPPTLDIEVDALYDYLGDTYDYFFRGFGHDGLDGEGLTIVATASYAPGNFCPNASWSGDRLAMQFCAGTATDDIVAHEYTHGLTQFTADLIYQNQSGQLNESFSDVFGEMVDLFNGNVAFPGPPNGAFWPPHPTGAGTDLPNVLRGSCSSSPDYVDGVRWLVGEDAIPFGGSIRDMWDPVCESDPDFANSPLQTCSVNDSGGVHSGSGVPNHAFAILTDGKDFNGFNVNGIGPIKAGAVWFRALTAYLTVASDFEDAYLALNQAAADLVGTFPNDPRTGNPSVDMFTAADADEVNKALLAVEMNTPGLCGTGSIVLRSDPVEPCANRTMLFDDDFESGGPGWTVFNSGPPTPFDWILTNEPLPFDRAGTAWFGATPILGICVENESAVHSLVSPVIAIPGDAEAIAVSFTHYLATEGFFDGGVLSVSVNGGQWQPLPRGVFEFNPYNAILAPPEFGNTNPLAGLEAWTGAGGEWGTSVADLSSFAAAGDELQLRFDVGRDGCNGLIGWYVDDVEVYSCPDCNSDGTSDHREFNFASAPSIALFIGSGTPVETTLIDPPLAAGPVTLEFQALADLASTNEFLEVEINGVPVGLIYETGASDCSMTAPDFTELIVPADDYNAAVAGGSATISVIGSSSVDPFGCFGASALNLFARYATGVDDVNGNGVPDDCECPADVTGDGTVGVLDLIAVISAWSTADPSADIDGNGVVDGNDLVAVINGWGACP